MVNYIITTFYKINKDILTFIQQYGYKLDNSILIMLLTNTKIYIKLIINSLKL